jgi:exosortase
MDQANSQLAVSAAPRGTFSNTSLWWQAGILLLILAFIYHQIVGRLVLNWFEDSNFSHGFFVPVFSGWVLWLDRRRLAAIPIKPSWSGLVVIVGAVIILILGVLGAELFLSRTSLIFLMAGLIIYFLGWSHFRAMLFPWICLFLMVPIPAIIFNQITFPLQLLASRFASSVLSTVGVPVLREGNILQLPNMSLEVAQACSGIRSLMSLGTLAVIYGYLLEPRASWRVTLAIASIPIAILANGLRVVTTGLLVYYWDPSTGEGFFHEFTGWFIFVLSLVLLFTVHGSMKLFGRWWARVKA